MRKKLVIVVALASMMMATPVYAAGPGEQITSYNQSAAATMGAWEDLGDGSWKYRISDGEYLVNAWIESQAEAGVWFFVGADGVMMKGGNTPDGYYVNYDGEYREGQKENTQNTNSPKNNLGIPGLEQSNGHSASNPGYFNGALH